MNSLLALILILLVSCACKDIKYQSDYGFLNSAQANSLEFAVKVNGSVCKDMDGGIGLCSKRVSSTQDIRFYHPPLPYSYRLQLTCSQAINSDFSQDVLKKKSYTFVIKAEKFKGIKSFICIGEIFPEDRKEEISAKWEIRVKVHDRQYLERECIYTTRYKGKDYLVLGKHSLWARVHHGGRWYRYYKKPVIRLKGTEDVMAMSESYMMRYNYYNYEL